MIQTIAQLFEETISTFKNLIKDIQIIKSDLHFLKELKELPHILTSIEAAKVLRISTRTLQEYRDKGYISYVQKGLKVTFRKSHIEEFLNTNSIKKSR